jgi:hypothetical protein
VALNRSPFRQCDVITTLDHSRATAFTQKPFNGDSNVQIRVGLVGMQGSKQPCSSRAQNQYVGLDRF